MNYLLIAPQYTTYFGGHYDFPLGLAYISAALKSNGYNVHCLNLNHRQDIYDAIRNSIVENNIDVVCTGGGCIHYVQISNILTAAKHYKPSVITVLGGGIFSCEPEVMLRSMSLDLGVINEGEITIVELARAFESGQDFGAIDGIAYLRGGEFIETKPRSPIMDLSTVAFADYDGFEFDYYLEHLNPSDAYYLYPFDKPRVVPMISSRSCPYSCTFCYHPLGKKYRSRPLDNFFAELDVIVNKYKINILAIYDELFTVNNERLEEFCARIKPYHIKWIPQLRVDSVDEGLLRTMKDAGCFYVSYGLESADNSVLESMKKQINISQIEHALALTKNLGIGIQGNFIFGDPAENIETINTTINWWIKNLKYQIQLTTLVPYPRSPLYVDAVEKGIIKDKLRYFEEGCPVVNLTQMDDSLAWKLRNYIETEIWNNNRIYAEIIEVKNTGYDSLKGKIFTLIVACPHCTETVGYNNFNPDHGYFKLGCRKCNGRFDLPKGIFNTKISVIMANYNHSRFLKESLDSIIAQTLVPYEVIVLDDCSTDNSIDIITEYVEKYPYIHLVINEKNMGNLYSSNRLIELAKGDYVAALGADDAWMPEYLQKSASILEKNPQAALCCTDPRFFYDETGHVTDIKFGWSTEPRYFYPDEVAVLMQAGWYIESQSVIFKKTSLKNTEGFIPELKWHADWFLFHVMAFRDGICYVPEILAARRMVENSFGRGCDDPTAKKEVLLECFKRLGSPSYRDIVPLFIKSNAFATFYPFVVDMVMEREACWNNESLLLIQQPMWQRCRELTVQRGDRWERSQELIEKSKASSSDVLRTLLKSLMDVKGDNSITALVDFVQKYPENIEGYLAIAATADKVGNYSLALQALSIATGLNPDDLDIRNKIGVIEFKSGKYPKAEESFREVLMIDPSNFDSLCNLAKVYQEQRLFSEAIEQYNKALSYSPNNVDLLLVIRQLALELNNIH
jgi:anaerobic magnesium-protoporphyrin IX monomethyl ester cyclase